MADNAATTRAPRKRRRIWRALGTLALLLVIAAGIALAAAWQGLGQLPRGADLARNEHSPEWNDGAFRNPQAMYSDMPGSFASILTKPDDVSPTTVVPTVHNHGLALKSPPRTGLRITWFGHSSALIEIDGRRVLTDPIWSDHATPLPGIGPSRFFAPPLALDELPPIDAVLISHDHYDHLDRPTILALSKTNTVFITPLGVGSHLRAWGVPPARVIELDWWQSKTIDGLDIVATPARHASGRISPRSDQTLWAGYALIGAKHRAFYSGDTGLHDSFRDIGTRYGPFDVALIESGQYDATWPDWHIGPEQAVEASRLVNAKTMIPVHWGLFALASHSWTEPAERVLVAARCQGVDVLIPEPGESVEPTEPYRPVRWWPDIAWQSAKQKPIIATRNGDMNDRNPIPACMTPTK